jgi:hypothetical protein
MEEEKDERPYPKRSFFEMGYEYAKAHPNKVSAHPTADRWSHLWWGKFSRRWWIAGFNAYRAVLDEQCEVKRQKKEKE